MEQPEPPVSAADLHLPVDGAWPLASYLSLSRNELSLLFGYAESVSAPEAMRWWQELPRDTQAGYQELLQALAAPALVANVSLVDEQTIFTTRAVLPHAAAGTPAFLVSGDAPEQREITAKRVPDVQELVRSLWEAVLDDAPPGHMETGIELDRPAFLLLMAVADLDRRRKLVGLLHQTAFRSEMLVTDLDAACREAAGRPDPRWLLPFFTALLGESPEWHHNALSAAIKTLVDRELLQQSDRGVLRLSPGGRLFIDSWNHPRALGLQVWGADPDGRVAVQACALLRGERFLWLVETGPPGDTVTLAGLDPAVAPDLLAEVLTPVGAAPELAPTPVGTSPETVRQGGYCPQCGQAVGSAASFCRSCGTRIES